MAYPNRTSDIQGQGRPGYNLPYRSGNDRPKSLPYAPKSVQITSPFLVGVIDIRWDNPASYIENDGLEVLGVNVYRAFDAPQGNYEKINPDLPVSVLYYRDETNKVLVEQEDVMSTLVPGTSPTKKWYFHTANKPILVPESNGDQEPSIRNVIVEIDAGDGKGYQVVPAWKVNGDEGLVYLNTNRYYDPFLNTYKNPILPDLLNGGIRVSYTYMSGLVATDMNRKIYYKVTTVAYDPDKDVTIETPLDQVEAKSLYDMERIDYIWAEAIRKNKWLLEQTGDRVKVFLRKWNGKKCECYNEKYGYAKGLSLKGGCPICYGTSYVGGYEGPFDILIAPPETEKTVDLREVGLHVTYNWNTWTGPEPLLNDRDVIVRSNNDRFFVSNANYQGSRGATYQQHFSLAQVDQTHPIYHIPIDGGALVTPEAWNAYRVERPSDASPTIPVKPEKEPGKNPQGRTVTFENISM